MIMAYAEMAEIAGITALHADESPKRPVRVKSVSGIRLHAEISRVACLPFLHMP